MTVDVTYDDAVIPQSPFSVQAIPGCDASRVKAYGPGKLNEVLQVKIIRKIRNKNGCVTKEKK